MHNRVDGNDMSKCDDNTELTHGQKLKALVDEGFRLTSKNLTPQQFAELVKRPIQNARLNSTQLNCQLSSS